LKNLAISDTGFSIFLIYH